MKYLFIAALVLSTLSFRCNKDDDDTMTCPDVNLTIVAAQTPSQVAAGSAITVVVRCSGSDLCYNYTHADIKKLLPRIFEIRTMGTYPCKPVACAQAIYYAEPSISIPASGGSGQYIIRYYNGNTLFRADTVTVN
ncbi:MAG: hypothetical protein JNN00_15230 [Chitinophagaceae bacterium]|nr:hypothetical protein [Chitinophagaceae bacterium]